jgi:hypothetical protein
MRESLKAPLSLYLAVAIAGGIASTTPDRALAMCSPASGIPTRSTIALVVDGQITFEGTRSGAFAPTEGSPLSIVFPAAFKAALDTTLRTVDVVWTEYGCPTLMDPVTGDPFQVEAVSVLTMGHFRSLLPVVAGRQSALYSEAARYSSNLAELGLLTLPRGVRLSLTATEEGWGATLEHLSNRDVICRMALGDPTLLADADQALGEVHCVDSRLRGDVP